MYEYEKSKIKKVLGGDTYDMLKEMKCVLAGGAITALFTKKDIVDYDIYFTDRNSVGKVVAEIFNVSDEERICQFDLIANHVTDRSLLALDKSSQALLQFIHYKVYEDVQDIFNSFDFTACMGAFDFATEEFVLHEDFMKANSQRTLTFNKGTDFPIVSVLRVDKYRNKGYSISKAQMLRVVFACIAKEYNDWDTVISEIGSMYGLDPKEIFDTEKPFSIDSVIDQLATCQALEDRKYVVREYAFETVVEKMRSALSEHFLSWYDALEVPEARKSQIWYTPGKLDLASGNKYFYEEEKPLTLTDFFATINEQENVRVSNVQPAPKIVEEDF